MRLKILSFLFLYSCSPLWAQQETIAFESSISLNPSAEGFKFQAHLPELQAIPGGRAPFYTYLWDFGDGHFSTEAQPEHGYTDIGAYEVQLYATNNYDFGTKPPRPIKKIHITKNALVQHRTSSPAERNFFSANGIFQLAKNANALPGQDMVLIAGLKAPAGKGTLFILTNEKAYGKPGFIVKRQSTYNQEKILPAEELNPGNLWASIHKVTATQSGSPDYGNREERNLNAQEAVNYFSSIYNSYQTVTAYEVQTHTDTAQFSFIHLDITQDMLKDTNAMVTVTGIFLPENGEAIIHRLDIPIVTSHDPNKMSMKQAWLSYRSLYKRKAMKYKVQFQNNGEGDAKNIRLEMKLPGIFDLTSFQLLHQYPKCPPCINEQDSGCWTHYIKGNDTLVFHFRNISLPGSKAEDITDKDSTKGFIQFTVKPRKHLPNRPFRSRTAIYFDKNEPVITNFATGRFRKSLSPILFGGYQHILKDAQLPEDRTSLHYTNTGSIGIGLAPLAPYRKPFWQVELYFNTGKSDQSMTGIQERGELNIDGKYYGYSGYDKTFKEEFIQLKIVPLHIRYNFNKYFSGGLGIMGTLNMDRKIQEDRVYYIYGATGTPEPSKPILQYENLRQQNIFSVQPFAEVNFGLVQMGPSLGMRYLFDGQQGQYLNFYLAWRL